MKTKCFNEYSSNVDKEINSWLKSNEDKVKVIEIKFSSAGTAHSIYTQALIIYEDITIKL